MKFLMFYNTRIKKKKMKKIKEDFCPTCNLRFDRVSDINGDDFPVEGDLSLCIGCGEILEFQEDLKLRTFPESEMKTLDEETMNMLLSTQQMIRIRSLKKSMNL